MLDITTLEALDDLQAQTLYRQEVLRLPKRATFSLEERQALVERGP
jgi:hypothetical protein